MALVATIKFCDPIRVPANHPLFRERDPAVRATLVPLVSFPSQPVGTVPGGTDPRVPIPLVEARRQANFYKSMHQRSAARADSNVTSLVHGDVTIQPFLPWRSSSTCLPRSVVAPLVA